jgi:hypothetical protein
MIAAVQAAATQVRTARTVLFSNCKPHLNKRRVPRQGAFNADAVATAWIEGKEL